MKKKWMYIAVCYIVALVIYLGVCSSQLVQVSRAQGSGEIVPQKLTLQDFALLSILQKENVDGKQVFVSTDRDPQLIYRPARTQRVTRFVFDASSHIPGGEIVLYYSTNEDGSFSEKNKMWARKDNAGRWYFDLNGKKITALRLDPSTVEPGVVWQVNEIALNAPKPAVTYFVPDAWQVALLLLLPLLAGAILWESVYIMQGLLDPKNKQLG